MKRRTNTHCLSAQALALGLSRRNAHFLAFEILKKSGIRSVLLALLMFAGIGLQAQVTYGYATYPYAIVNIAGANYLLGQKINVPVTTLITHIGLNAGDAENINLSIYSDNANAPGALLAQTGVLPFVAGQNLLALTASISLSPGNYWVMETGGPTNFQIGAEATNANGSTLTYFKAHTYTDPLPANFGTGSTYIGGRSSIYLYGTIACTPPTLTSTTTPSCSNASNGAVDLTVLGGTPGYTYLWTTGATTQDLTNRPPGTYTVTVTDAATCTGTASATVASLAVPTCTITGPPPSPGPNNDTLCISNSYVFSAPAGMSAYQWSVSANGSINGSSTGQSVTVTPNSGGSMTVFVTVTNANGCTSNCSYNRPVQASPTLSISGPTPVCSGSTGNVYTATTNGYIVHWSITGNGTIVGPTTGPTVTVTAGAAGSYTLTGLVGFLFSSCTITATKVVAVNNCCPPLPCSITGADFVCSNSPGNVYSAPAGMASYSWSISGGGSISGSATGSSVSVTAGNFLQDYTLSVTVTDFNGCTSSCSKQSFIYYQTPEANITANPSPVCFGATLDLSITAAASSTLSWSGEGINNPSGNPSTTATPTTTGLHTYSVMVTTSVAYGSCTNTGTVNVMVNPGLTPPTITGPSTVCPGGNATLNAGTGYNAYAWSNSGGSSQTATFNNITTATTYAVTVTGATGCIASDTHTVTPIDGTPPSITCPANTTVAANASCQSALGAYSPASVSDNCAASPTVTQSPASSTVLTGHNTAQTVTLTANDGNGNIATCSFTVVLKDVSAPSIACPANTTLAANASCQSALGAYSAASFSDNCNPSPTVTQSPASSTVLTGHNTAQTVALTANDGNGNTATCSFTVTLRDVSAPSIACPANTTVAANGSCQGTVGSRSPASLSDNCNPSPVVTQSPASSTVLTGHNTAQTVTLTTNDGNGNIASCSFTVTLKDVSAPTFSVCLLDQFVSAGANCTYGLPNLTGGVSATDNCTPSPTITQSIAPGTALPLGDHAITYFATDQAGNSASVCTSWVFVRDNTAPTITCPANTTIAANASCQSPLGSYSPASLSDNCTTSPPVTQSPASSTILTGNNTAQTVTLTATDAAGNPATCSFTVTLKDVTPPSITCPNDLSINANANCQGTLSLYTLTGGSDNCSSLFSYSQSPVFGTVISGPTTVILTAIDNAGNTSSCDVVVSLQDVTPPSIACPANTTVAANASCQSALGAYSAASLSDNCAASPTATQSPASSTILTGHNTVQTVTLMGNDGNGNTATCSFTVTLKDVSAPSITCPANTTVAANASCQSALGAYSASSISDNCNPSPTVTQSPASSTILTGHNTAQTVTLTANDGNGNTATCSFTVTLKDVSAPSIACPANTTVAANASCQSALGAYSPASLSDNCNPSPTVTQSPASSTVLTGHNTAQTVTLMGNDGNGNTATCSFTVTLKDVSAPTVVCKTYTANLSAAGTASITTANVFQSGADNCGTVNQVSVLPNAFTCANIGANTVVLSVNDGNGNTASCAATVTVADITPPTVVCKIGHVSLNAAGAGTLPPADVFGSGSDNCGIVNLVSVVPNAFTCANLGANTVVLTVNDGHGNTASCSTPVKVYDALPPTMICQNITVNLSAAGAATITAAQINAGSTDNCTLASLAVSPTQFTCANLGANTVILTGTDQSSNSATCSATVTVRDVTAPTARCKNATISLNASGTATVQPSNVNNNSLDECGGALTFMVTPSAMTCANVGANTVTLKVTDPSGNSATCTARVTVQDKVKPSAKCKAATVFVNASGVATVTAAQVNNGSSDACGIASLSIPSVALNCGNVGGPAVSVVLTVTDVNGNTAACTAAVTVKDNIPPTAMCSDITVKLGANGLVNVVTAPLAWESTDNCFISTFSPTNQVYNSSNIGVNYLTINVIDQGGNASPCVSEVTVLPFTILKPGDRHAVADEPQDDNIALRVFPNPAGSAATATFTFVEAGPYELLIYGMDSHLLLKQTGEGVAGENRVALDLSALPIGAHALVLRSQQRSQQTLIVVQR